MRYAVFRILNGILDSEYGGLYPTIRRPLLLETIWDVFSDLVDLRIGRFIFGQTYRRLGIKTPHYQFIISGLLSISLTATVIGGVLWALHVSM